jgi:cell division protein ZapA
VSQIEVQIMGQSYALACPDGAENRLEMAVQQVDQAMCKIRDAGKIKARERIAVLAAINLAFEQTENKTSKTPAVDLQSPTDLQGLLSRLEDVLSKDGQLL